MPISLKCIVLNRKTEQAIKLLQQNLSIIHFCIIQLNWSYEIHEICEYVQCTAFKILIKGYL